MDPWAQPKILSTPTTWGRGGVRGDLGTLGKLGVTWGGWNMIRHREGLCGLLMVYVWVGRQAYVGVRVSEPP